jgi:hypothetical protein
VVRKKIQTIRTLESIAASSRALAAAARSLAISSCADEDDILSDEGEERMRLLRRMIASALIPVLEAIVVIETGANPCADSILLVIAIVATDAMHSLAAKFDRDDTIFFFFFFFFFFSFLRSMIRRQYFIFYERRYDNC